jgi:hypothetical protein
MALLPITATLAASSSGLRLLARHNDVSQQPEPKKREITASTRVESESVTLTAIFPDDGAPVKVGLYNILGKLIEVHPLTTATKGETTFRFFTKGLPTGPYILVLESSAQRLINKVMISR